MWIAVTVVLGVAGFVVGRWWLVLLPLAGWPLYFLGLGEGWWGSGLGDGSYFGLAFVTALGVAAAAVGVALRGLVPLRSSRTASR